MKKINLLIAYAALCFVFSCKKKAENTSANSNKTSSTTGELVIYTKEINNNSKEVSLSQALIKLYETETNRTADAFVIQQKKTDTTGTAHFYQLSFEKYYLKILHPNHSPKEDVCSTPHNSVSYNTYVLH